MRLTAVAIIPKTPPAMRPPSRPDPISHKTVAGGRSLAHLPCCIYPKRGRPTIRRSPPTCPLTSAVKTNVVKTPAEERRLPKMKRIVTLFPPVSHPAPPDPQPPGLHSHHPRHEIQPDGLVELWTEGPIRVLVGGDHAEC
jgi:hypothetical protein